MDTYSIIFSGEVANGKDKPQVKENLANLYKIPTDRVEVWFSGKNIIIKKNCNQAKALKIKKAFASAGAISHIKSEQKKNSHKKYKSVQKTSSINPITPSQVSCPKCGFKQLKAVECSQCGIIMSKYLAKKRMEKPEPLPKAKPEPTPANKPKPITEQKKSRNNKKIIYISIGVVICLFVTLMMSYVIYRNHSLKQLKLANDKLSLEQLESVYIAIKRIEGAVNSGVNYQNYGTLVSTARSEIEIRKQKIGLNHSVDLAHLIDAYNEYQTVKILWGAKTQYKNFNSPDGQAIIYKLKLLPKTIYDGIYEYDDAKHTKACIDAAMQYLWKQASLSIILYDPK